MPSAEGATVVSFPVSSLSHTRNLLETEIAALGNGFANKLRPFGPGLRWFDCRLITVSLIRTPVAGEYLNHVLRRSNYWCCIEADMHSAGDQSLLLDIVTGEANHKNRTDDRNCLEDFLGNFPPASFDDSLFSFFSHHNFVTCIQNKVYMFRSVHERTALGLH
jgi:hypothetical protein